MPWNCGRHRQSIRRDPPHANVATHVSRCQQRAITIERDTVYLRTCLEVVTQLSRRDIPEPNATLPCRCDGGAVWTNCQTSDGSRSKWITTWCPCMRIPFQHLSVTCLGK